jgi:hypothetical protein
MTKLRKKQDPSDPDGSKYIIVGNVFHDILDPAMEDVAQAVDGVGLHVFILAEPVKLGAVDVVVGVQGILGYAALLHRFP